MVFIRYQHVERIDADEAEGLLDGVCHIFPKMDGSNMCAYTEDGKVCTMSRNKEIQPPEPFAVFIERNENVRRFLTDFPGLRLYGEWMVPHTVRSYRPDVWNRWFVFDVTAEDPDAVYAWGDGNEEEYKEGITHRYEKEGERTVIINSKGAEEITLQNLVGVTSIDLSGF